MVQRRRSSREADCAVQCIHSPETGLPSPISFWEPHAAERQQILRQTSHIPDPNMRALLTRKMMGQLKKEKSLPADRSARSTGSLPQSAASGNITGGRTTKMRARSAQACGPQNAASRSAKRRGSKSAQHLPPAAEGVRTPRSTRLDKPSPPGDVMSKTPVASRPRPKSAPAGGRAGSQQGNSFETVGNQTPRGAQWLPHWIAQSDWDAIVAMERRSPTTASAGRADWLGTPPWQCSFMRPWQNWAFSSSRAGNRNIFGVGAIP